VTAKQILKLELLYNHNVINSRFCLFYEIPQEFKKPSKSSNSLSSKQSKKTTVNGISESAQITIELAELWISFKTDVTQLIKGKIRDVEDILKRECKPLTLNRMNFEVVNNSHADVLFAFRSILRDVFEERIFAKEKLASAGELKVPGWPCKCDIMYSISDGNQKIPIFVVEVKNPSNLSGN
jgi:hypothetical protein